MIHRTSSIEIDPSSERVAKLFKLGFEYSAQKCVKYDSIRTIISTNVFEEVEGNLVTLTNKYVNQGNAVLYVLDEELVETFDDVLGDWKEHIGRDGKELAGELEYELAARIDRMSSMRKCLLIDAATNKYNKLVQAMFNDESKYELIYDQVGKNVYWSSVFSRHQDRIYLDTKLAEHATVHRDLITADDEVVDIPVLKDNVQYKIDNDRFVYYRALGTSCPVVLLLVSVYDYTTCDNVNELVHKSNDEYFYTADDYQVYGSSDVYYCEDNGEYYYMEDNMPYSTYDENEQYNFGYHDSPVQWHESSHELKDEYRIGFEVEKEDYSRMTSYYAEELLDETSFRKERDGSLNDNGYELISPVYKFDLDIIKQDISKYASVRDLLAGSGTSSCGTHFTLSRYGMMGEDIFARLVHWLPLLYSLYPSRANPTSNTYSKPQEGKQVRKYYDRYSSMHVDGSKLEVRIFPVTKTEQQLYWRLELLRILLDLRVASMKGIRKYCKQGRLHKHLMKVYNNEQYRIDDMLARAEVFAKQYKLV